MICHVEQRDESAQRRLFCARANVGAAERARLHRLRQCCCTGLLGAPVLWSEAHRTRLEGAESPEKLTA
jgi:hypothetical protein